MPLKAIEAKDEREPVIHHMDTVLSFGKYKGRTVRTVVNIDPAYIQWAYDNIAWFDMDAYVEEVAEENRSERGFAWWADPDDYSQYEFFDFF